VSYCIRAVTSPSAPTGPWSIALKTNVDLPFDHPARTPPPDTSRVVLQVCSSVLPPVFARDTTMVTTAALHSAAVSGSTVAQRRASLPRHLRSQSGRTHSPACRCSRCVSVASAERREQVPGRKERSVVASAASTITRELEKLEEALM